MFQIDGIVYIVDLKELHDLYKGLGITETKVHKMDSNDVLFPSATDKVSDIITLFLEKVLNESPYDGMFFNEEVSSEDNMEPTDAYKLAFNTLLYNGVLKIVKNDNGK